MKQTTVCFKFISNNQTHCKSFVLYNIYILYNEYVVLLKPMILCMEHCMETSDGVSLGDK